MAAKTLGHFLPTPGTFRKEFEIRNKRQEGPVREAVSRALSHSLATAQQCYQAPTMSDTYMAYGAMQDIITGTRGSRVKLDGWEPVLGSHPSSFTLARVLLVELSSKFHPRPPKSSPVSWLGGFVLRPPGLHFPRPVGVLCVLPRPYTPMSSNVIPCPPRQETVRFATKLPCCHLDDHQDLS